MRAIHRPADAATPRHTRIARVDHEARALVLRNLAPDLPGEPLFAPYPGAEDDGVILSMVYEAGAHQSARLVLEKREQTYLDRASKAVREALSEGQVIDAGLDAARDIAPCDLGALTLYDAATRTHRVRKAVGHGAEALANLKFPRQHLAHGHGGQEPPFPAVPRRARPAPGRRHQARGPRRNALGAHPPARGP